MNRFYLVTGLVTIMLAASCAPSKEVVTDEATLPEEEVTEPAAYTLPIDMNEYRIRPQDAFFSLENQLPEVFQPDSTMFTETEVNAGFRIQIISSQEVAVVEEARRTFNQWLYEDAADYQAETYILFRQPYFRLHVGNFKSRANAIAFNTLVKRKFPDAWIVHDQIDPEKLTHKIVIPDSLGAANRR